MLIARCLLMYVGCDKAIVVDGIPTTVANHLPLISYSHCRTTASACTIDPSSRPLRGILSMYHRSKGRRTRAFELVMGALSTHAFSLLKGSCALVRRAPRCPYNKTFLNKAGCRVNRKSREPRISSFIQRITVSRFKRLFPTPSPS